MLCSPTADSFIKPTNPTIHINKDVKGWTLYHHHHQQIHHRSIGIHMACTGLSYQRLKNNDEIENEKDYDKEIEREINQIKARIRFRWSRSKKVHIRKKLKMKIPSLRKFMRRKARLVMASLAKVLKRLKESQSHLGDLFAGNYLFIQVAPTPLKSSSIKYQ